MGCPKWEGTGRLIGELGSAKACHGTVRAWHARWCREAGGVKGGKSALQGGRIVDGPRQRLTRTATPETHNWHEPHPEARSFAGLDLAVSVGTPFTRGLTGTLWFARRGLNPGRVAQSRNTAPHPDPAARANAGGNRRCDFSSPDRETHAATTVSALGASVSTMSARAPRKREKPA